MQPHRELVLVDFLRNHIEYPSPPGSSEPGT